MFSIGAHLAHSNSKLECPEGVSAYSKRLGVALNSRDKARMQTAMQTVRAINERKINGGVGRVRIATSTDFGQRFSDTDLDKATVRLLKRIRAKRLASGLPVRPPGRLQGTLAEPVVAIMALVAIAKQSKELSKKALTEAVMIGDHLLAISIKSGFSGLPLPMQQRRLRSSVFAEWAFRASKMIGSCEPDKTAAKAGWLVARDLPQAHFLDTALAAEAFMALSQITGEARFREWAVNASKWIGRQPIATDFFQNAFPVAMDAELYLTTSRPEHLVRAIDRATFGIIPGMIDGGDLTGRWVSLASNTLGARLVMTRALVKTATAVVAAPAGEVDIEQRRAILVAAQKSWRSIEADLVKAGGIAQPGLMIETILDIERAKLAGMPFGEFDRDILKQSIAIGVRQIARGDVLEGAAAARLLAALKVRSWRSAFRDAKRR